ncbi:MAG: hypothetical protein U1E63_12085 [Burkholderiales bacterium]
MSAIALTIAATGVVTIKTTVLMTPEEVDEATKKTPSYRRLLESKAASIFSRCR